MYVKYRYFTQTISRLCFSPLGMDLMKYGVSTKLLINLNIVSNPFGPIPELFMNFLYKCYKTDLKTIKCTLFFFFSSFYLEYKVSTLIISGIMKLCITKGRKIVFLECTSRMEYMRTTHLEEELCFVYKENENNTLMDSYDTFYKNEKQLKNSYC